MTTFPFSPYAVFTFVLSSSELQLRTFAPTFVPTSSPTVFTPTSTPTTTEDAFNVVINNLVIGDRYLNLAEVQLFDNNVQIPRESLAFTLSSTYQNEEASHCNDGITSNHCVSGWEPNPSLTIVSAAAFDTVVVYNRNDDCYVCRTRIEGATITVTVNGQSQAGDYISILS